MQGEGGVDGPVEQVDGLLEVALAPARIAHLPAHAHRFSLLSRVVPHASGLLHRP